MSDIEVQYNKALDYLYSFVDYSLKHSSELAKAEFNLDRMYELMDLLGNPQAKYPIIHVAGTKGKGSVSALCASALQAAGYKVGLYTSPHLMEYTERIQVDGNPISFEQLVDLVEGNELVEPAQLLIRLHPNHFWNYPLYQKEADAIRELGRVHPHVHVVEPVPLGGELGYYSGEDMPEKSSMMAHSDVFTTVYSTMVVEAAIHERPIVSVCIDQPGGWNTQRKYSLALSKIGNWPTHQRFRDSGAGKVALDKAGLRDALNHYLRNDQAEGKERRNFIRQECTYVDGSAGQQTADFFLKIINQASSSVKDSR